MKVFVNPCKYAKTCPNHTPTSATCNHGPHQDCGTHRQRSLAEKAYQVVEGKLSYEAYRRAEKKAEASQ